MKKRDTFYITILFILPILFVLCVSTYSMYGSKLDWLSQHISLADYFRQTQQLLPDSFTNLQGQTNAFSFSYYGLLRPDVLVSYLFPNIPIYFFIIGYATLLWSFTGGLCYCWLRNKGYKDSIRFFSSICCICANCFFQSHQQIMFIEILPFLFLSMILVDKNKRQWISLCVCMALFHNYFYTPGMILILLLYDYDQNHTIKDILIPILIGVGMATILWLPTGYLVLNNHKSVVQTNLFNLLIPYFTLKGLVYDSYGCGLTVISWIALFQGIQFKNKGKNETRSMLVLDGKDKLNITDHDEKVMSIHSNGIYLTEKLAEKYGIQVGDKVTWHLTGDSSWHTSKVIGLNRDPQTQQFTMSKKYFEKLGYTYREDSIYTNKQPKKIDGVSKISSIESIQEGVESMLEAMKSMMVLLIVFAVLLGCVILYNLGVLSFTEKQYQFATLKVLGFKDKQIKEIFIKQNTWIMLVGMVIGLPLGYYMLSYIYTNALNETYDFPAVVEWISYVYAIIGTVLVSYVMNKLLARKIKTIDMVSSLKANE